MILMLFFFRCRWCSVSASQSSSNWVHTCLYHIINESTRRKTIAPSDRLRHKTLHWRKEVSERFYFSSLGPYFSQNKRLTFSPDSIFKALWAWPLRHLWNALKASRGSVCFYFPFLFNHLLALPESLFVPEKISYQYPKRHWTNSRKL